MIRFDFLEKQGAALAAMSDAADGDCSLRGVDAASPTAGRARFAAACGIDPAALVCMKQVHGKTILRACAGDSGRGAVLDCPVLGDADAVMTDALGLPIGVMVADCVPLLLFDPRRKACAAVHAGREGTVLDIAGASVAAMAEAYGTAPGDLWAVIGPSAGPSSYEVSEDMAAEFADAGLPVNGRLLDLWGANRMQLERAGVAADRIEVTGICTIATEPFFSYRRTGTMARNLAIVML